MTHNTPLSVDQLYRRCDNTQMNFTTSTELPDIDMMPGQERALEALKFGAGIQQPGYNMYILGPSGSGKRRFVEQYLTRHSNDRAVPSDYCYVHNFKQPLQPILIQLMPGGAIELQQDMQQLIKDLHTAISADVNANENRTSGSTQRLTSLATTAFNTLRSKYSQHEKLQHYLNAVQNDVIAHLAEHHQTDLSSASRYRINVLVDNAQTKTAPLIYADNPLSQHLLGRIEYKSQTGGQTTDFTLIKAGALHQANGGYLLLDAAKLIQQPLAWDGLKRALASQQLCPPSQIDQPIGPSLDPEPMPINLKAVLIGERALYQQLIEDDPQFAELFKVAADFEDDLNYDTHNIQRFTQFIATIGRQAKLRPFDSSAICRVIEHAARLAEDKQKLSLHLRRLTDLLSEADHWAGDAQQQTISSVHIQQAIDQQILRMSRFQQRCIDEIQQGVLLIDTQGEKHAQINALSIIEQGEHAFGQASRVTATVRLGDGDVVDIEREVDLGGPIHSKGVFILANFLGARFAKNQPLSLHAALVFEQNYEGIDGDSASMAELCVLLSVLANVPIKQSLAITGSVNQLGESQVIGGVNEKIEGFYDICQIQTLNGQQGVLIPAANVQHLMLREDVRQSAQAGKFHIYAYEHIDQAIEILTGIPAGELNDKDEYPHDSINQRVYARLTELEDIREKTHKEGRDDCKDEHKS